MAYELAGKVVLITGAAGGIGAAMARALHQCGACLVLTDVTQDLADRLAATLGDRPAALMKSHGAVTVGQTLVEAFVLAAYMEENAQRQFMAMQLGQPYVFDAEELALCRQKLWSQALFQRAWDHFRAKLPALD